MISAVLPPTSPSLSSAFQRPVFQGFWEALSILISEFGGMDGATQSLVHNIMNTYNYDAIGVR